MVKLCVGGIFILLAFFREAFDAEDLCGRVCFCPFGDENVVLVVESCDVGDLVTSREPRELEP